MRKPVKKGLNMESISAKNRPVALTKETRLPRSLTTFKSKLLFQKNNY